ncbi:MAG: hypothetical protein H6745_09455 [Deltaproteobacteria bacterium]|nr:hypothetical protein [Deltaproteobacteria bacterium]
MRTAVTLYLCLPVVLTLAACGDSSTSSCSEGFVRSGGECVLPVVDADSDGVPAADDCDDGDAALGAKATDGDCDGVLFYQDCDDANASVGDNTGDLDCDGVPTASDCDDSDPAVGLSANDADCDGVATADDCDDNDASVGSNADDMDCDGVATADDCDDNDDTVGSNAGDMDCDGVATADDCDDDDDTLGATAADMDCDGVLTADDCDDTSAALGATAADMDCDGVLTADDCDDNDDSVGSNAGDMDCDGVLTADDCDDSDDALGAVADDTDCDGTVNASDECPDDPEYTTTPAPTVDVAFPGLVSATNGDEVTVRGTAMAVCGTTVTGVSVLIDGSTEVLTTTPTSGDVVSWSFSVTLEPDALNTFVVTATSSASLDGATTVTVQQHPAAAQKIGEGLGMAVDPATHVAYVVDAALPGIIAVDLDDGATSILSGPDDGAGAAFSSSLQGGAAVDAANNRLLVTDDGNDNIVAVDLTTGDRTVLSDNTIDPDPAIGSPFGIVVDAGSGVAYYLDSGLDAVVSVNLATGMRAIFSDDTTPASNPVNLDQPRDLVLDAANNRLLFVDTGADDTTTTSDNDVEAVIAVSLTDGARSYVSGDGHGGSGPALATPRSLAIDGTRVYVADSAGVEGIVLVDLTTANRSEYSGETVGVTVDEGADFTDARAVYVDAANERLVVLDSNLDRLVAVSMASGSEGDRTFIDPPIPPPPAVGSGPTFADPSGVVVDPMGRVVYVADDGANAILAIDLVTGARTVVADSTSSGVVLEEPRGLGWDAANGRLLVPDNALDAVVAIDIATGMGTTVSDDSSVDDASSDFGSPRGAVVVEPAGTTALVADTARDAVYRIDLADGTRTYLAHDVPLLDGVQTLELDAANNRVLVTASSSTSDTVLDALLAVDLTSGAITVLANKSTDTTPVGTGVDMTNPRGVVLDAVNGVAYVLDADLDALVAIDLTTLERTIVADATTGSGDHLSVLGNDSNALAFDSQRGVFYAVAQDTGALVAIDVATGDQVVIAR